MLKKLRLLFDGRSESESHAKKRIKLKQQALAEKLKQNQAYQEEVRDTTEDTLDLS